MSVERSFWRIVVAMLLLGVSVSLAGRPLHIDDADPVDRGMLEFEVGVGYEKDAGSRHWDFPFGLTYGVVTNVEVGFAFGGQIAEATHTQSGIGDLDIAAKWRFLESCPMGARHALVPAVKFPTADEKEGLGSGEIDYDLTWVVSWAVGDRAGLHCNLGYTWIGGREDNAIHCGVAVDYQVAGPLQWVGEVFAENEAAWSPDHSLGCNTGLRWRPNAALTLDAAAGAKLHGDLPDSSLTVGATYLFGMK